MQKEKIVKVFDRVLNKNRKNGEVAPEVKLLRAVFAYSLRDYMLNNKKAVSAWEYLKGFEGYGNLPRPTANGQGFNAVPTAPAWMGC